MNYINILSDIPKVFENYKEDISFDGDKRLIKVHIDTNKKILSYTYIEDYDILKTSEDIYYKNVYDNTNIYITKLLKEKIIEDGHIYNYNDNSFLESLKKHKTNIICYKSKKILEYEEYFNNNCDNNIEYQVTNSLLCEYLLNNTIHCCQNPNSDKSLNKLIVNIASTKEYVQCPTILINNWDTSIVFYKFKNIYYDYSFIKEYLPKTIYMYMDNTYRLLTSSRGTCIKSGNYYTNYIKNNMIILELILYKYDKNDKNEEYRLYTYNNMTSSPNKYISYNTMINNRRCLNMIPAVDRILQLVT